MLERVSDQQGSRQSPSGAAGDEHSPVRSREKVQPTVMQPTVINHGRELPMRVLVGDRPCHSHSTYTYAGGSMALTISTVVSEPDLAVELVSSYLGHPQTHTFATHLLLGPIGRSPELQTVSHRHEQLDPAERPRACAYNHAQWLIDDLRAAGHTVSVEIDESSFSEPELID